MEWQQLGYDPAGSVTGNNKVWRKFTFSPITTSKIRVTINAIPDGWSRVVEIQAFGTSASGEKVQWLIPDHLGTPRIILEQTGSRANVKRHDYLPFGEELFAGTGGRTVAQGYAGDGVSQQFTSKERDLETGLDYFGARYYASIQGRFTSVDPVGVKLARMLDPQQLNRYSFVRNSPLKYIDFDGNDLKLAEGLKKGDTERILKHVVKMYRKESGREAIEKLAKSDIKFVMGRGSLKSKGNLMTGSLIENYGLTQAVGFSGTIDSKTGKYTSIDRKSGHVTITFDCQKRDDAQTAFDNNLRFDRPPYESHLVRHELGHANDMNNDMVKQANQTDAEAEVNAEGFANKVDDEKDTMTEEDSEKRVREILGLPPKEEKKKKKMNGFTKEQFWPRLLL